MIPLVEALEDRSLLSDLIANSVTWNGAEGGVDFSYSITGADLPEPTTAALFWSPVSTFDASQDTLILGSVTSTNTAVGAYGPIHVDAATVGTAPADAKYLLAVVDPDNTIDETDETNNVAFVAYDPLAMDMATSPDSKDISFTYDVSEAEPNQPIAVGVYRSSSSSFDPSAAILVNEQTVPPRDSSGGDSEAVGQHTVVIQDPMRLLPDPLHEYVFVVADPAHDIGDPTGAYHAADYRKFVLGVVVHGLVLGGSAAGVPQWETDMAANLQKDDHFDQVIAFDWASSLDLPIPGVTVHQGQRLANQIAIVADSMVASEGNPGVDVVDLDLIGHSRGAVVVSQALQDLVGTTDPILNGGYKTMTMLDPHPANVRYFLGDHSFGKYPLKIVLEAYLIFETFALDPQMVIPANVDQANLYFQHTPARSFSILANPTEAILNLWGEEPKTSSSISRQHRWACSTSRTPSIPRSA